MLPMEFFPSDSNLRESYLIDVGKKTVLVIFDFRRYQESSIQFAEEAAERGATIVLVTDPYLSPISHVANCVLPVQVEAPSPFDSQIAAMAMVEILVAGLIEQLGDKARLRLEMIETYKGLDSTNRIPD